MAWWRYWAWEQPHHRFSGREGSISAQPQAAGEQFHVPLPDRLVCRVPRVSQASRSPSIQIKTSITVRIARSASCLSVRLSVCLSSLCLSVFSTVSARLSICDHRLSVCPPLSVTSYLSDFCLMRALWLGWQHDGGPNTPSWEVRSMFPSCRAAGRPGGRVRGGSLLSYYCSLSICT